MDMFFFPRWHLKIDTIQPSKPFGPKMVLWILKSPMPSSGRCGSNVDQRTRFYHLDARKQCGKKRGTKEKTMSKLPRPGMIENGDMCHLLCGWCFLFCANYWCLHIVISTKCIRAIKAKLDSFKSALRPMLSPKPRLTLHQLACCHVPWLSLMYIEMVSWGNGLSYASLSFGLADLEKYLHSKQLRARSLKLLLNLSHKKYCHQYHQHSRGLCLS